MNLSSTSYHLFLLLLIRNVYQLSYVWLMCTSFSFYVQIMQTPKGSQSSSSKDPWFDLNQQPAPEISPHCSSDQISGNDDASPDNGHVTDMAIQVCTTKPFFTPELSPATAGLVMHDSPSAISSSSNRSIFSPQGLQSYISDPQISSDKTYGSPVWILWGG
ncbi:Belongs to the GRAS [Dionaea muscipula]